VKCEQSIAKRDKTLIKGHEKQFFLKMFKNDGLPNDNVNCPLDWFGNGKTSRQKITLK
jgi:hypothetical protein